MSQNEEINPTEGEVTEDTAISEDSLDPSAIEDPEALRRLLEEAQTRSEAYLANWQRAQADFINYRRRVDQDKAESTKYANAMLILSILPVVDDLERALTSVSRELAGLTWVEGVHLIYRKLQATLEAHGLSEIGALGQPFDPNLHEAVMYGDGDDGIVTAELQKGYSLHDRVIRPTLVKVGRRASSGGETSGEGESAQNNEGGS